MDSHTAIERLREGNERFAAGMSSGHFSAESRAELVTGQAPWAIVVGCSDSRVPVEAVFDATAGDLFVVRSAGHVLSETGTASVRFAVEKLGARAIVVLGHEDCGAVSAWMSGEAPGWLAPITDRICEGRGAGCLEPGATLGDAVEAHARETAAELQAWLAENALDDGVDVVPAAYRLASGVVHWLD